jgi:methyltransferase (TIGR00027 family)
MAKSGFGEIKSASDTARQTFVYKYITSEPSFWKSRAVGKREKPLSHTQAAAVLISQDEIESGYQRVKEGVFPVFLGVRERWFNKKLHFYVKKCGYQQIVNLGAGYDIRALKKNRANQQGKKHSAIYEKVKFWEIDHAVVLDEKEKLYKAKGLDPNATYIKMDYAKSDFVTVLKESGIDINAPTLFIWEGNVCYLEPNERDYVINQIKMHFANFVILMDYNNKAWLLYQRPGLFKQSIDNIEKYAEQKGLVVLENTVRHDLEESYELGERPDMINMNYFVCALSKSEKPIVSLPATEETNEIKPQASCQMC